MLLGRLCPGTNATQGEKTLAKSIVGAALGDEALLTILSAVSFALELSETQRLPLYCRNGYAVIFPS